MSKESKDLCRHECCEILRYERNAARTRAKTAEESYADCAARSNANYSRAERAEALLKEFVWGEENPNEYETLHDRCKRAEADVARWEGVNAQHTNGGKREVMRLAHRERKRADEAEVERDRLREMVKGAIEEYGRMAERLLQWENRAVIAERNLAAVKKLREHESSKSSRRT